MKLSETSPYEPILGKAFFTLRQARVFSLRDVKLTRDDLPNLGIINTNAVGNLQRICEMLDIRSIADLLKTSPTEIAEQDRTGVQTLHVAIKILRLKGHNPVRDWYQRHEQRVVTFDAIKDRVRREHANEKRHSSIVKQRQAAANSARHSATVRQFIKAKSA